MSFTTFAKNLNTLNTFHKLSISEVKKETPDSVSISFEVPANLKDLFTFKAGQYITIKHNINNNELRRAYSICSTPSSAQLTIGIKKVEGGTFSVFANSELKAGDSLEVMPPKGNFILDPNKNVSKNYVGFIAGSGITPVLSIVQTALEEEPDSTFLLNYGNRSKNDTMFYDQLQKLKSLYPDRLFVEYIFSRTKEEDALFGRIDRSIVNFLLKNKYQDRQFNDYFICGPEAMIEAVSSTLEASSIAAEKIHIEHFTSSENDIEPQTLEGMTEVTIVLDDETENFSMNRSKSILEAALAHKLDAPFSCQGGICSTCIARLVEGKAEMRKNQILTDEEIADGLILTCQAHPTTPKIEIDYDDV